ncbi:SDR family NAD(P)-dependent oxidoreductase [Dyella dinghuensis]|uniref:SDR family NAD(P)-dependent oxidoreductase n=1 Tax=Dyella dinghuensis TaxID=1920169 RepID=A0A432LV74_9GAMM|nr:oxidoreductase [Dyella dinghuensis]RUL64540.1 SDR family NAD(P)-dependent oxidoreductase [Dyella dinghuensis]
MPTANWFVTGISRGFGKTLCEELLVRGYRVVGTTRNGSSDITHENLMVMQLDVTDEQQTEQVIKQAIEKMGRIDVVVNNAGFGMVGAVEEVSTEEAQATFDTNFFGTFNVIRAVAPHFRANRSGHIVNFSSVGGITGSAGFGIYNAAKFAIEGLSEALDLELKPFGITVTIVEPGYFRTEFLSSGSIKKAAKLVDAYADTVGKARNNVSSASGNQPGDPAKAVRVIVNAVESPSPPLRLPLGSDCYARIDEKLARLKRDMDGWRAMATATQFDP